MKISKPSVKYRTVSLGDELIEDVVKHISTRNYRSVADFVRTAVREKMEEENSPLNSLGISNYGFHSRFSAPGLQKIAKEVEIKRKEKEKEEHLRKIISEEIDKKLGKKKKFC